MTQATLDKNAEPGLTSSEPPTRRMLKGLVLAGGKGSRLRPLTATGAKQLVPVANKPVLFYALEQLVSAGITEIGIVIGDTGPQVMAAVGDGSAFEAKVTYLQQDAPRGLAHGVIIARDYLGDSPFCMYLADNFLEQGIEGHVRRFAENNSAAQILLKRVEDVSALGVAVLNEQGHVTTLVEKPKEKISDLAIVGVYFFGPQIHDITPGLQPSGRGELEITDAIQGLLDAGLVVDASIIDDEWIDTGKKDDMLEANRVVLGGISRDVRGTLDQDSIIVGDVVIEAGAVITGSTVRGPAIIGAGTRVEHAYIGPFTAIGERCLIRSCEIEHSIVMNDSVIRDIETRISDSLVGKEVVIERTSLKPVAIRLMLGDHAHVGIS